MRHFQDYKDVPINLIEKYIKYFPIGEFCGGGENNCQSVRYRKSAEGKPTGMIKNRTTMNKILMLIISGLMTYGAFAAEQNVQPTATDAHQFISQLVKNGALSMGYPGIGKWRDVGSYSGHDCLSAFSTTDGKYRATVDWTQATATDDDGNVHGTLSFITEKDGAFTDDWLNLNVENAVNSKRMVKALKTLLTACAKKSVFD
jgi:hypothetical protein